MNTIIRKEVGVITVSVRGERGRKLEKDQIESTL